MGLITRICKILFEAAVARSLPQDQSAKRRMAPRGHAPILGHTKVDALCISPSFVSLFRPCFCLLRIFWPYIEALIADMLCCICSCHA